MCLNVQGSVKIIISASADLGAKNILFRKQCYIIHSQESWYISISDTDQSSVRQLWLKLYLTGDSDITQL